MFQIKDLRVEVAGKKILHGLSLAIGPGEVHAIMGPNGSGKSTLANALMGHPSYKITGGSIVLNDEELVAMKADKRAQRGLFLAFQYPKEIPGVTVGNFVRTAVNAVRKARKQEAMSPLVFRKTLRETMERLSLPAAFMNRYINDGFSGGEKKKMEIVQMAMLEPKIAVLDETDSGLDVDALRIVSKGILAFASRECGPSSGSAPAQCRSDVTSGRATGVPSRLQLYQSACRLSGTSGCGLLLITHYQRILHYVKPDFIHVMMNGKIVKSGGKELGAQLEKEGYEKIL